MEAVGGLTARDLSGFGLKGIVWFAASSILASVFGIVSTLIFQPGAGLAGSALVEGASNATGATSTTWQSTLTDFFGSNIVASMVATSAGTLSTTGPMFVFLLIFIVILVGALSFFPALALGPVAEFLGSAV